MTLKANVNEPYFQYTKSIPWLFQTSDFDNISITLYCLAIALTFVKCNVIPQIYNVKRPHRINIWT